MLFLHLLQCGDLPVGVLSKSAVIRREGHMNSQAAKSIADWIGSIIIAIIITCGVAFCFFYAIALSQDKITPEEETRAVIAETFHRIDLYSREHKTIPPSLDVLPRLNGHMNQTVDAWNRPLKYSIAADTGIMTLTSFGKDGIPGGSGENTDISESYYATHESGTLWVGADLRWIVNASVTYCPRSSDRRDNQLPATWCSSERSKEFMDNSAVK